MCDNWQATSSRFVNWDEWKEIKLQAKVGQVWINQNTRTQTRSAKVTRQRDVKMYAETNEWDPRDERSGPAGNKWKKNLPKKKKKCRPNSENDEGNGWRINVTHNRHCPTGLESAKKRKKKKEKEKEGVGWWRDNMKRIFGVNHDPDEFVYNEQARCERTRAKRKGAKASFSFSRRECVWCALSLSLCFKCDLTRTAKGRGPKNETRRGQPRRGSE